MHNLNMGEGSKIPPSKLRRLVYRNGLIFQLREQRRFLLGLLSVLLVIFFWLLYSGAWSSTEDSAVPSGTDHKLDRTPLVRSSSAALTKNGRLFYNRVPKCGSSTLNALLKKLAAKNGYTYTSSPLLDDWFLVQPQAQEDVVTEIMALPPHSAFDRHLFFLDFAKFGKPNPIYINMIRDPTERFISEFYFRRRLQNEGVKKGEKKWYDEDLENCIKLAKDYDCRLVDGMYIKNMIAFFCGNDIECSKHNSQWALDKAKFNVQNFFAVVGILEDLEKTLRLLERKLPQYFSGALELHTSSSEHIVNKGKNKKADVAQEIKDIIRKNLTAEYEFYEFIRGRLQAELKNNEQ